jgi:tRNA threonylcarbamoyladenosine biosynthesis protein TsaB
MPSLNSLVAAHGPLLLIDSASATVQVGLLRREAGDIWHQAEREAGIAIFECADAVLNQARIGIGDLGALIFCEGPGSMLGIRTAAMAMRTWQAATARGLPAYAYRSLELVAHDLLGGGARVPFAVVADARRDTWHWVEAAADKTVHPLQRVATPVLNRYAGDLCMPTGFRTWAPPPREVQMVPYSLAALWRRQSDAELLRPAPEPEAYVHEESSYVTWTPQIHRAPSRNPL